MPVQFAVGVLRASHEITALDLYFVFGVWFWLLLSVFTLSLGFQVFIWNFKLEI
jgi:ABC-type nickel/cobalt efflux system permease component RcnA